MSVLEIFLIGVALSMDAFAVSVCKGLAMNKLSFRNIFIIALYFGFFQALMPTLGFYLGTNFQELVADIDHWIAFVLLSFVGGNMIFDTFKDQNIQRDTNLDFKTMIVLAIATSIDALAIGFTFGFLITNIYIPAFIIGSTTFLISSSGVILGNKIGNKFQNKAELIGGIILILIGTKILLEHLGILVI